MRARSVSLLLLLLLLGLALAAAAPAAAQAPPRQGGAPPAATAGKPGTAAAEPELKFEREYYLYPVSNGRDPFGSLAARSDLGPRFEELVLRGIIYSQAGQSVALLADAGGRIYRVKRGQIVGNARVLSIAANRVIFAVDNFGVIRQEQIEMKRKEIEGAGR